MHSRSYVASETRKRFIADVKAFLASTGMPKTRLGLRAVNDGSFVNTLLKGRSVTLETYDTVVAFMRNHNQEPRHVG